MTVTNQPQHFFFERYPGGETYSFHVLPIEITAISNMEDHYAIYHSSGAAERVVHTPNNDQELAYLMQLWDSIYA